MASITKTSITYDDLKKNIDEQSLINVLLDITEMETAEERATDFIYSTFYILKGIAIKVSFDISDFDDTLGIKDVILQAYIYLTLGVILNSGGKNLGYGFKNKGMKLLETIWGSGIYSDKELDNKNKFFCVSEKEWTPTGKMSELYDNDLFS